MTRSFLTAALSAAAIAVAAPAFTSPALADAGHVKEAVVGKAGKASAATRTIEVTMIDNEYKPASIEVKPGETIKFVVKNEGQLVHEFNIGTAEMHMAHQKEMQMMVDHGVLEADKINHEAAKKMQESMGHGMHKEPNSVLLEPGKSGTIVWTFPKGGTLEFACNVPGHYGAGMVGKVAVSK